MARSSKQRRGNRGRKSEPEPPSTSWFVALLRYVVVAAVTGFAIKLAQLAEGQGEVWAKQLWDLLREASAHVPSATLNLALLLLNVAVGVKLYLGFRAQGRAVSLRHWALLSSGFYVLYALSAWLNKSIVLEGFWAAATDATYGLMALCILDGIMPTRRTRRWAIAGWAATLLVGALSAHLLHAWQALSMAVSIAGAISTFALCWTARLPWPLRLLLLAYPVCLSVRTQVHFGCEQWQFFGYHLIMALKLLLLRTANAKKPASERTARTRKLARGQRDTRMVGAEEALATG